MPPAPLPDIPATAEPCTPAAELLATFDEYQTAFEDADGPRLLSLHTVAEQERQILACLRIIRDRLREHPALAEVLHECGATRDLLEVAAAHNADDRVESEVAAKTVLPRLRNPSRVVTATLKSLAADGPVEPQLFNLAVTGDQATATLVLQYPLRSDRSRLEFTRASGQWLIAAEKSVSARAPPPPYARPEPRQDPAP